MIRTQLIEDHARSVLNLPNVKKQNYKNYVTLLDLLRSSLSTKETQIAKKLLEDLKNGV